MKAIVLFLVTSITLTAQSNHSMEHYLIYTVWANDQLVEWLHSADKSAWEEERSSSFTSLNETTQHLWNAEYGWLTSLKEMPWSSAPKKDSKRDVLTGWQSTSRAFAAYGLALLTEDPEGTRIVGESKMRIDDILLHVCNHATYHRGQLITLGRQVGLEDPPRTDYVYFMRLDPSVVDAYRKQLISN
jgi:uncharacterized damage-inducible protein DinB